MPEGSGIFSVATQKEHFIVVGGDYEKVDLADHHVMASVDGRKWEIPKKATRGYRECVEFYADKSAIAIGPTGAEYTIDYGNNWEVLSDEKDFHVVRKARKGKLVIATGGKGKIAVIEIP